MRDYDRYKNITSATTTQIKLGCGTLKRIVFNTPVAASTVTVVDNVSGVTPVIGVITNTANVKPYDVKFNLRFTQGLRIITSGADNITVVYE